MPQPTVDSVAPNGVVNLSDAPAALDDATFDSLFPSDGTSQATPAAPQVTAPVQGTTPSAPTAPATTPTPSAPFLKGDKSVYNTPEDAQKGINEKDALIEQLRQRYALTTGIDPISGQPIGQQPVQRSDDYSQNPEKYLNDLYLAAKSGGPQAYGAVQQKFILDTLKPLQPVMQRAAREQAVENLSKDLPDIKTFIGTPAYDKAIAVNPELGNAIAAAETDFRFHDRLPGLYKIAYLTGQGLQLPDILKAQTEQARQNQTHTQPVRTTTQTSTPAMPQQTTKPTFKTIDGIKSIIAEAEGRGAKLDF